MIINYIWLYVKWHPTPVLLPGKSHGRRSLVGCSPWVAESWTRLSDFTFTFHFHALEKAMATHSSILAWRILGTGEPGGLPSKGSHRVGHNWSDLAAACWSMYKYFVPFRGWIILHHIDILPLLIHSPADRHLDLLVHPGNHSTRRVSLSSGHTQ